MSIRDELETAIVNESPAYNNKYNPDTFTRDIVLWAAQWMLQYCINYLENSGETYYVGGLHQLSQELSNTKQEE